MYRNLIYVSANISVRTLRYSRNDIRTFLSEAYLCNEAWQKRFESPVLKDVNMKTYFIEVDRKFQTKRLASGVDIDIFANCVTEEHELQELEHLLYRFRRTKRAAEMLDSTSYAVVRAFLHFRDYESLFRILRDRQNYGVFPDLYSYNILMDTFLEQQQYRDAAEIAVLMMLQEDFSNPISRLLGLYSCQKFLTEETFDSWSPQQKDEKQEEDDDEDVFVRVPFLRNPWYDDHFDIKDPKHLLGKTFYLIGREENNVLGQSYKLLGLGLYGKWEKAMSLVSMESESSPAFLEEAVEKFKENLCSDESEAKTEWMSKYEAKFKELKDNGKIASGSLEGELMLALQKIPQLQSVDIEEQKALFQKWDQRRQDLLKEQKWDVEKEQRLKVIAEKKEELYWKEKLLFFFENEDAIMDELKKVEEIIESQKKKVKSEETYEPPEIVKKKPTKMSRLRRLAMVKSLR